jgi:hypothetical protein
MTATRRGRPYPPPLLPPASASGLYRRVAAEAGRSGAGPLRRRAPLRRRGGRRDWDVVQGLTGRRGQRQEHAGPRTARRGAADAREGEADPPGRELRSTGSAGRFLTSPPSWPAQRRDGRSSPRLGVDTTTPTGELVAVDHGFPGALGARIIGQRTKDALAESGRRGGVRLGRPPEHLPQSARSRNDRPPRRRHELRRLRRPTPSTPPACRRAATAPAGGPAPCATCCAEAGHRGPRRDRSPALRSGPPHQLRTGPGRSGCSRAGPGAPRPLEH